MVTIRDIARLSGCGVSTVSRALNDHPDVSQKTKLHIKSIVEQYGFVPNNNAKNLKQQATNVIGIVVKGTANMLFSHMIEEMSRRIKLEGYTGVTIYLDEESSNEVEQAARFCRERKPLGLLFLGGNIQNFKKGFGAISVPAVLISTPAALLQFQNLSSVATDDRAAAACAVDYLFSKGHTNIGVLGKDSESLLRFEGCKDSFRAHGRESLPECCFEEARFSYESAYRAMGRLYKKNPSLTAVFAMSDVMAIGALRALSDLSLSVPGDVSVMGFDGTEIADYYTPRITSIAQDSGRLAARGVELLLIAMEGGNGPIHETMPFSLSVGESVSPIGV